MLWYWIALRNYAVFEGRAGKKEFWIFTLTNVLIALAANYLDIYLGLYDHEYQIGPFRGLFLLFIIIPTFAVTVRRLHDTGRTGWWALLYFIPLGVLVLIYFLLGDGDDDPNRYGLKPPEIPTIAPSNIPFGKISLLFIVFATVAFVVLESTLVPLYDENISQPPQHIATHGAVPHTMQSHMAKKLQKYLYLPTPANNAIAFPQRFLQEAIEHNQKLDKFSALMLIRESFNEKNLTENEPLISARLDAQRPRNIHYTRAMIDTKAEGYLLDEWVILESKGYAKSALWYELQSKGEIEERVAEAIELYPEQSLGQLLGLELNALQKIEFERSAYIYAKSKPYTRQTATLVTEAWF